MKKIVFMALASVFMLYSGFVSSERVPASDVNESVEFQFCDCNLINFYYDDDGVLRAEIFIVQTQSQQTCRFLQRTGGFQSSVYDDLTCQENSLLNQRPDTSLTN